MGVDLEPGAEIAGKYTLRHRIGEGGMGMVWSAKKKDTGEEYALKFIKGDTLKEDLRRRFIREARAASAVRHEAIVDIIDIIELDDGSPVLVMEFLHGESLGERLDRDRKVGLRELATMMQPVVSAVGTAHSLGIVHRDLKPENIFLARRKDDSLDVKVLDFGIAKLTAVDGDAAQSTSLTGSGTLLGTPYYMAPEQIFGERDLDHRTDVWALGVILYECLTGMLPTEADNIGQVLKIVVTRAIPSLETVAPDLPEDITDLVNRMLARNRQDRPNDLREVHGILKKYGKARVTSFGAAVQPASEPSPPSSTKVHAGGDTFIDPLSETAAATTAGRRPRGRGRGQLAAIGVGAILALGGVWWVAAGSQVTESSATADAGADAEGEVVGEDAAGLEEPDEPQEQPSAEPTSEPTDEAPATAAPPKLPRPPRPAKPKAQPKPPPTSQPTAVPTPTKTDPDAPPIGPKAWK